VSDRHAVGQAMVDHDAVLCALRAATPLRRDPTLVAGVRNITAAMVEVAVRRLVYLSFLAADHAEKEEIIRRSGLDWTIVRPPRLTNGPQTGS
jgi:uncharacterized protein YbjT (DUF2867 family)